MASLTVTPSEATVGEDVVITGEGFEPSTVVTLAVVDMELRSEIVTDAAGFFGTDDVADRATATLTLSGNAVADETVTLGAVTYTWKGTVASTANEVLVGASAAASLQNLKDAVNLTGTTAQYGSATVIHPTVGAGKITATTLLFYARTGGTGGNSLASTEAMTNGAFGDTTFVDTGSAATGVSPVILRPEHPGTYEVTATDGTNSATATMSVWAG